MNISLLTTLHLILLCSSIFHFSTLPPNPFLIHYTLLSSSLLSFISSNILFYFCLPVYLILFCSGDYLSLPALPSIAELLHDSRHVFVPELAESQKNFTIY